MSGSIAKAVNGNQAQKFSVIEAVTNVQSAQEILPASTDYSYAVFHVTYSASAAGSATLNSASTAIYATLNLPGAATVDIGSPQSNQPLCVTKLGEALTVTTTGTANHSLALIYAKIHK